VLGEDTSNKLITSRLFSESCKGENAKERPHIKREKKNECTRTGVKIERIKKMNFGTRLKPAHETCKKVKEVISILSKEVFTAPKCYGQTNCWFE